MKFVGGRAPYGFEAVDGELVFAPTEGGLVLAWMMKAHRQTYSYRAISMKANAQGWKGPAGGEWNYGSVARVIKRGKELSHLIPFEYAI